MSQAIINSDGSITYVDDAPPLTPEQLSDLRADELAANGERWALENRYITLCDQLRMALGQQATRAKLGFENLEPMMLELKQAAPDAYRDLYDGMAMLNSALIRFDVKWWDTCTWHPEVAQ